MSLFLIVSPPAGNDALASAVATNRAIIIAILALLTAVIAGLFTVIRTRSSGQAAAQTALNGTMETLTKSLESRVSTLEKERDQAKRETEACEARYRALEQHLYSLEEFFRGRGFDIPRRPHTDIVLFLDKPRDPSQTEGAAPMTEDTSDA